MDPTETLTLMIYAIDDQEFDEARDYADDLIRWLAGGGFPPTGCNRREVRELCQRVKRSAETVTPEQLCIGE